LVSDSVPKDNLVILPKSDISKFTKLTESGDKEMLDVKTVQSPLPGPS